jgi:PTS system fructose-specific IIC component
VGAGNPLTAEEIAQADVVLIAADREVDRSRFAGKRVLVSNTKPAITGGAALIEKALAEAVVEAGAASTGETSESTTKRAGPYKHLMTGVSFMLPCGWSADGWPLRWAVFTPMTMRRRGRWPIRCS